MINNHPADEETALESVLTNEMAGRSRLVPVEFPPLLAEPLDPEWELGVAAQHIVLSHFREMLNWRSAVIKNLDVEAVHQIRVSARRCRTALQTFAALWPDKTARRFASYIASFADSFGTARDIDVMIIWLEQQLAAADTERASAIRWLIARNRARREAEQPGLEQAIFKLDQDGFPAAFIAYYSRLPLDLWELALPARGEPAEAIPEEQELG